MREQSPSRTILRDDRLLPEGMLKSIYSYFISMVLYLKGKQWKSEIMPLASIVF
jgi:hypothetical protein